jgi:hypothetical protein
MPLDPDRFRELSDKLDAAKKRFDEILELKRINDAAEEDEDWDEDEDEDEDIDLEPNEEATLVDPAEEAVRLTWNRSRI